MEIALGNKTVFEFNDSPTMRGDIKTKWTERDELRLDDPLIRQVQLNFAFALLLIDDVTELNAPFSELSVLSPDCDRYPNLSYHVLA